MDTKLVRIVLSCQTPEQVSQCMSWVEGLQSITKENKHLLISMLEARQEILRPLEVI